MKMTVTLKRLLSMQRPSFFRFSFVMISLFKATTKRRKYSTKDIASWDSQDLKLAMISWVTMGKSLGIDNDNNNNSYYYLIFTCYKSETPRQLDLCHPFNPHSPLWERKYYLCCIHVVQKVNEDDREHISTRSPKPVFLTGQRWSLQPCCPFPFVVLSVNRLLTLRTLDFKQVLNALTLINI